MPSLKPLGLAKFGRRSLASDEEIISAYVKHIEVNGHRPNTNELRLATGCSYARIERVLNDFKSYESISKYHESKETQRVKVMTDWLVETQRAQAEHMVEIIDKETAAGKEEWIEQAKLDLSTIKKLEGSLTKAKTEIEELKCRLLEEQSSHNMTQEKLGLSEEAKQQKAIHIAELNVALSKSNETIADKQKALDNSNRNFDHALKESARQRKSLEEQLQHQTESSRTALQRANDIISVERENARAANEKVSTLAAKVSTLNDQLTNQTAKLKESEKTAAQLQTRISELSTRTAVMAAQLDERQKAADQQAIQINQLRDERNQHYTSLQHAQSEISELSRQNTTLQTHNGHLEQERDNLKLLIDKEDR